MTPTEINTTARQRYNAVSDDFWPDAEVYGIMYQGSLELAAEGLLIERTFSVSSVVSQQEYSWPTNALSIKRITYAGRKLVPISFREDDVLTVLNSATTATGTPTSYAVFNKTFYLRPIPVSVQTMKVFAYCRPTQITVNSTLEIDEEYHMSLVNLILAEMSAKNKNYQGAEYYRNLWNLDVIRAKKLARKKYLGDAYQIVKNVDNLHQTDLGQI